MAHLNPAWDVLDKFAPRVSAFVVIDTKHKSGPSQHGHDPAVARIVLKRGTGGGQTAVVHWYGTGARSARVRGSYNRSAAWEAIAKAATLHDRPAHAEDSLDNCWKRGDGSRLDAFLTALEDKSQWEGHNALACAGFKLIAVL